MDEKERAKKDIDKLDHAISEFKKLKLDAKYPQILEYAENYFSDSKHFFDSKDYFTSFGAANYAYGFIDAILILEGKKDEKTF